MWRAGRSQWHAFVAVKSELFAFKRAKRELTVSQDTGLAHFIIRKNHLVLYSYDLSSTMRFASFALLLSGSLPSPSTAGVATHEVAQLGDQSLVAVQVKNETLDFDISKATSTEEFVEEIVLDQESEDEDEYYDEDEEQISEAYSTSVSAPAVHAADEVGSDLGTPQVIDSVISDDVRARISDARIYIQDTVMKLPEYEPVRGLCVNKNENCAFWAEKGECDNNPAYMHLNCAPVCFVCEMLHVETRCPMPDDRSLDAFQPGDLDKMFERILTDPYYQQFEPIALSRPTLAPGDTLETAEYKVGGPWVSNWRYRSTWNQTSYS